MLLFLVGFSGTLPIALGKKKRNKAQSNAAALVMAFFFRSINFSGKARQF